jgi:hypothetical protein
MISINLSKKLTWLLLCVTFFVSSPVRNLFWQVRLQELALCLALVSRWQVRQGNVPMRVLVSLCGRLTPWRVGFEAVRGQGQLCGLQAQLHLMYPEFAPLLRLFADFETKN